MKEENRSFTVVESGIVTEESSKVLEAVAIASCPTTDNVMCPRIYSDQGVTLTGHQLLLAGALMSYKMMLLHCGCSEDDIVRIFEQDIQLQQQRVSIILKCLFVAVLINFHFYRIQNF